MTDPALTERDAAVAWAMAYNLRDASLVETILAEDLRVVSQWVVQDLVGRDAYLGYLRQKFATFETVGSFVRVEFGETPADGPGASRRPCGLLEQDGVQLATVLFIVVGGWITEISLGSSPPPVACRRSGLYPGIGAGGDEVN